MRLVLKPVQTEFTPENPAKRDYFDEKGVLLLSKGQIPHALADILNSQQVYSLHYELSPNQEVHFPNSPNSGYLKHTTVAERVCPWVQQIYIQAELIDSCLFANGILFLDQLIEELEAHPLIAAELEALRDYDQYTYMHSISVALLSYTIASVIGYSREKLKALVLGALLHDIGKLTIPVAILNKPVSLSDEEYRVVQSHPTRGVQRSSDFLLPRDTLSAIMEHHERWNGCGYPHRLFKDEIHPYSRIIAVADVFDALITDRPYRPGIPPYHAIEMMIKEAGNNFSPEIIHAFLQTIQIYPANSLVTLDNGESGVVMEYFLPHPTRPIVRILFDSEGRPLENERIVNLIQDPDHYIDTVKYAWVS